MHMCDQREWFFREHIFPIQACISLMHWIWKWNERFWCLALFLTYRTKNFVLRLKQHSLVTSSGLEQDTVRTLHACISCFSHVRLFWTLWTVAHQAPLSVGFSRQEYWSGLMCPPPFEVPYIGTLKNVNVCSINVRREWHCSLPP